MNQAPTTPTEEPSVEPGTEFPKSPVKAAIEEINIIRETMKTALRRFGDVLASLRQADKEKRVNDREVEAVREKIRGIQSVRI